MHAYPISEFRRPRQTGHSVSLSEAKDWVRAMQFPRPSATCLSLACLWWKTAGVGTIEMNASSGNVLDAVHAMKLGASRVRPWSVAANKGQFSTGNSRLTTARGLTEACHPTSTRRRRRFRFVEDASRSNWAGIGSLFGECRFCDELCNESLCS